MPRHPHEPVTPMPPVPPPFPPAPPCGCTPPRMRPEPFSPSGLPAPHGFDFGKWAREKIGWLLSLVPSAASEDNQLADKAWVEGQALGGKADKVENAVAGNLAGLDSEGNLTDSGAKPGDFVGKAALFDNPDANPTVKSSLLPSYVDDVLEYASLSNFPQSGETGKIYVALDTNIQYRWSGTQYTEIAKIIPPSTTAPAMDGAASPGSSNAYSRGDHVHPTDTSRASKSDVDPLLFAQHYPEGNVKSAAEFTAGIKYDDPDTTNRTITVKPFCNTDIVGSDNSDLSGRVVIPPFVDASGNGYISDDGTRFKVVGVSDASPNQTNSNLTDIIAPNTVTSIGQFAFDYCEALTTVSFPAVTTISDRAFNGCSALSTVDFGATPRSSVPSLGTSAFNGVPTVCKIIVPYTQYDAWTAASGWSALPQEFVRHAEKADKPAAFTTGNLAKFDANGNPTDSAIPAANVALKGEIPYALGTPIAIDTASSEVVEGETVYYGAATLANRTANIVQVTAATALDELRITFPAATSGKVRDFGLRVEIGTGSAALAAPALVPIAPTGETIKIENNAKEIPALADGTATAKGVTLLYFSENAPGIFVVKGEQVEEVA